MTIFFIGFGLLRLLGFTFSVLLLIKIATVIGKKIKSNQTDFFQNHGKIDALNLAAVRFADGIISADKYREIKSVLKD